MKNVSNHPQKKHQKLPKTFYVATNGCPENRIDSARLEDILLNCGWMEVSGPEKADAIFFNACALTLNSQENSIKAIEYLEKKKKASAELIVIGCLSKINLDRLRTIYSGFTCGSDDLDELCRYLDCSIDPEKIQANVLIPNKLNQKIFPWKNIFDPLFLLKFITELFFRFSDGTADIFNSDCFLIKISSGCLNTCSFCGVKKSRGHLKSKTMEQIQHEFKQGLKKGYTDFVLIGTDIGAYGRDRKTDLGKLLLELIKIPGDFKIRLRNVQPRFLIQMLDDLKTALLSGKISYLSSALESGNDRILGLMKRGYKAEDFKQAIQSIRKEFPDIYLSTQIICGFPQETKQEFMDTVRFIDEVRFDSVEAYVFQSRPDTEAAKIKGPVTRCEANKRLFTFFIKSLFKDYHVLVW